MQKEIFLFENPNLLDTSKPVGGRLKDFKRPKAEPRSVITDSIAKSCNGVNKKLTGIYNDSPTFEARLKKLSLRPDPAGLYRCTSQMIAGQTSNASYFKAITCGKDWCRDCGAMGSMAHQRRTGKIYPRLKAILDTGKKVNYLIITIPSYLRQAYYSKEALNDFRTYWRRKLKREGFSLGVSRWHWAGEDGRKWHPHLNLLIQGAFIPKPVLYRWRAELSQWWKDYFSLTFKPGANIYTSYTADPDKLRHWVNYVFRATLTQGADKLTQATIYKYRNTAIIGAKKSWPIIAQTPEQIRAEALKGYQVDEETGEIEKIRWMKNRDTGKGCQRYQLGEINLKTCEKIAPGLYRRWYNWTTSREINYLKIAEASINNAKPPPWNPQIFAARFEGMTENAILRESRYAQNRQPVIDCPF
jgi:hypothetical protein